MALPYNPSRGQIFAEFGSNTASNGGFSSDQSLKKMYSEIFGAGSYSRDAFGGYGRPDVSSISASAGQTNFEVSFSLSRNMPGNDPAYVFIEHSDDPLDIGTSNSTKTPAQSYTSDGTKTINVTGVAANTTHHYRVHYYNAFNDQAASDYNQSGTQQVTTQQLTLNTPNLLDTITYSLGDHSLEWNTSGAEPTGFDFEYRVDGGSWQTVNGYSGTQNWGTGTNPKSADIQTGQLPNPGELFEFRVRATRSGYTTSAWSNVQGYQH